MAKSWAKQFYHSKSWLKVRRLCLIRDYNLCQICGDVASIVHHIIELSPTNINNTDITINMDNLMCVCHTCHQDIHDMCESKSINDGLRFDENGDIIQLIKPDNLREE